MLKRKDAITHFQGLGRLIANTRRFESRPCTPHGVFQHVFTPDHRSGVGTKNPFGGDSCLDRIEVVCGPLGGVGFHRPRILTLGITPL